MPEKKTKRSHLNVEKLVLATTTLSHAKNKTEIALLRNKIGEDLIPLFLKKNTDNTQIIIEETLEQLQKKQPQAFNVFVELLEEICESRQTIQKTASNEVWQSVLIAAPILVWTRYTIGHGQIDKERAQTLHTFLREHIFSDNTHSIMVSYLHSIDQLPADYVETYQLTENLTKAVLDDHFLAEAKPITDESSIILADPRFLIALVISPMGSPLFRWEEKENEVSQNQKICLENWQNKSQTVFQSLLTGCEFKTLLPNTFHQACREADKKIRSYTVNTAIRYLTEILKIEPDKLRAVIGEFGDLTEDDKQHIEEYRIGFTKKGSNDILYGIVWPLYGKEIIEVTLNQEESNTENIENIIAQLKENGVSDIRHHQGVVHLEYCDDCDLPLYLNPQGEVVHAEMPEEVDSTPLHYH